MKYLICIPLAGLGNKMRVIASAEQLATLQNRKLIVLWLRSSACNARFDQLFKPKSFVVSLNKVFALLFAKLFKVKKFMGGVIKDVDIRLNLSTEWLDKMNKKRLLVFYTCEQFVDKIDLSMFQPNDAVQSLLCAQIDKHTIGVHIRRGDNMVSIMESPLTLFIREMDKAIKENPYTKFYLATDSEKEQAVLEERYKDRILIYKKRSLDRNSSTAIVDAMVDLYNLARCKKILGSYYSSFSQIAALIGNQHLLILKK